MVQTLTVVFVLLAQLPPSAVPCAPAAECPDPAGVSTMLEQADKLLRAGKFADARAASVEVLKADPDNAAALKIKGNSEYFLKDFDQSISTFIKLLDRHPADEEGAYMLGRIYYQEGRIDQAIGQFERVLKSNARAYKAWDNLGLCWEANGNDEKAIKAFLNAIRLVEIDHPEYDWAYANLAEVLIKTGDFEHAFAAASKAAKRNPDSARNFYIGAKALDRLGKDELCVNWLSRAAGLDPTNSEVQYLLARVYGKLGQTEKSDDARKKFLALKSKEPAKRR